MSTLILGIESSCDETAASVILGDGDNVKITYSTPYADFQYFDASLQHNQGPHAGTAKDHWMDPYINGGTKFDFVVDKYKAHYSNELRRIHV